MRNWQASENPSKHWKPRPHRPTPDETQPIQAIPHISDRDIERLLSRLNEKPELAAGFLPASLLYT